MHKLYKFLSISGLALIGGVLLAAPKAQAGSGWSSSWSHWSHSGWFGGSGPYVIYTNESHSSTVIHGKGRTVRSSYEECQVCDSDGCEQVSPEHCDDLKQRHQERQPRREYEGRGSF